MSRVFLPYNPHKLDKRTQELVPAYDLAPAEQYGELVFLLSPNANPLGREPQKLVEQLHAGLERITPEDHLLLIGNPALIALTASIAAQYLEGMLRLLQWNGTDHRYIPLQINVG